MMVSNIVLACASLLSKAGLTIAFAESATAGRATSEFARTPQSGNVLLGGVVCYDAGLKEKILKVPSGIIEQFTPESPEVTAMIARKLTVLIPADFTVGITGLTSPGGSEKADKPVGTMFVHIYSRGKEIASKMLFKGNPEEIILQTIDHLAAMLIKHLEKIRR